MGLLKWLPVLAIYYTAMGCFNSVQVPDKIKVEAPTEVTVIHTVELSAQITDFLDTECQNTAVANGFVLGTPESDEYVKNCTLVKTEDLINELLIAIGGATNPAVAPNMLIKE